MTVELLNRLSLFSFIGAGLLFLFAIALFFLLDIPKVFGEVTGRTAKKSIERIKQHNADSSTGRVGYADPSKLASHTKVDQSGKIRMGTEKFVTSSLAPTNNGETTLLDEVSNETTLLTENQLNAVPSAVEETTLLASPQPVMTVPFELIEELTAYYEAEMIE